MSRALFMQINIAFLLQEHFYHYCKQTIGDSWEGHTLTYFCYTDLKQLQQLFLEQKSHYDAFFVSGPLPLAALWEVDSPPYAIKDRIVSYLANTYRILLGLLLKQQVDNPSRIGIDFVNENTPLIQVLEDDRLPELIDEHDRHFFGMTTEELDEQEVLLVEEYRRRCRAGKLDVIITNYNSVVRGLAGEPVKCYYSYPSRNAMIQSLDQCVKKIQTEKLRRNQSAVIRISPKYDLRTRRFTPNHGLELLSLKSCLLEYCRRNQIEPVLKDDLTDVELYLTVEQLGNLTNQFSQFHLPLLLEEQVGFQGYVSLGSGVDLSMARSHAMQAQDYRTRLDQEVCIYLDEQETIHSLPISTTGTAPALGVSADDVTQVANRCHLSAETVYRVISAMKTERTNLLTSEALIRNQGFSLRVANRVLSTLTANGYAEIVGQRRIGNKGRPQNLHRILLNY